MPVKHSNNFIRCIILPLAVCAMMFSARCSDDGSEELTQQALLSLVSCKGGTMTLSIDGAPATTWACCIAVNKGTYWEVVSSQGSQVIRLYFGKIAAPHTYTNDSALSDHEYIEYIVGSSSFCGVEEYETLAESSITIDTDNATSISGDFTGTLYNEAGTISHNVDCTDFEALK